MCAGGLLSITLIKVTLSKGTEWHRALYLALGVMDCKCGLKHSTKKTSNESVRVKTPKSEPFCVTVRRWVVKIRSRVFMRAMRSSALWGSMRVSTQAGGLSLSTLCVSSGLVHIEKSRNASDQEWSERYLCPYIPTSGELRDLVLILVALGQRSHSSKHGFLSNIKYMIHQHVRGEAISVGTLL